MLIDDATDRRAEKGGNQKCTGEDPEHDCPGQAEPRSYGVGKDREETVARPPGERLGRAECSYNDQSFHPA
jgi:hypothetical protein